MSNTAVVALLAPIVSAQHQDGLGTLPEQPAYTPSAFAHRLLIDGVTPVHALITRLSASSILPRMCGPAYGACTSMT